MAQICTHLDQIREVAPSANGCEDCLKIGDSWVHLRLCLTCGHVGCCDDSKNKHATRHFHATNHPIIQSFEPGEDWAWCYIDELLLEPARAMLDLAETPRFDECDKAAQRPAQPERKEEGKGNEKVTRSRSQQHLKL